MSPARAEAELSTKNAAGSDLLKFKIQIKIIFRLFI
jgi:hypothetical protein